ncbi:MAG: peptidase M48, partial [Proteobacteria bacterium]
MTLFSIVFLIALAISTGTRLWLARRHIEHIRAHRDLVPSEFASEITLEAHHKAADYSSAKTRLAIV